MRRSLRLASGLVLFTYITAHLINHALGLVSLKTAEAALEFAVEVWSSPLGTVLLYGALWVPMFSTLQTMIAGLTPDPVTQQRAFAINFTAQNAALGIGALVAAAVVGATRIARRRRGPREWCME